VAALLAKSNLDFALQFLQSYQHTVGISQEQNKAGAMSKVDLLKIQLQTYSSRPTSPAPALRWRRP